MDRTCVSTGRSPETSGPRRLNAPTPTLRPSRSNPARTGCPSCTVTQARRASAMVVAHFFESASDAVYVGPSRERTANGRRSSAGQHRYIAAIDEKAWAGTSARPGVQGSHSVSRHCHGDSSRAEYARRKVESSFWSGGWIAAQLRPPGQAVVRRTVPLRSLDDWLVLRVINSFTAPVLL